MSRDLLSFENLSISGWREGDSFSYNGKSVTPEVLVGRGTFGAVYRCSVSDGTRLALKVVTFQDESSFDALRKDALVSNILYGQGEFSGKLDANQPFYALLPFFEGITLESFFRDYKPDSANPEESKAVLLRVWILTAHAVLQLRNRNGLQHGDLYAGNIMISPDYDRANLIDFQRTQRPFFNIEHMSVGQFLRDNILLKYDEELHFHPSVREVAEGLCKISKNISLKEAIFRITSDCFTPLSVVIKNKEWCVLAPVILKIQLLSAEIKTALQENVDSKQKQQSKVAALRSLLQEVEKHTSDTYVANYLLPAMTNPVLNTGIFRKSTGVVALELVFGISPTPVSKKHP